MQPGRFRTICVINGRNISPAMTDRFEIRFIIILMSVYSKFQEWIHTRTTMEGCRLGTCKFGQVPIPITNQRNDGEIKSADKCKTSAEENVNEEIQPFSTLISLTFPFSVFPTNRIDISPQNVKVLMYTSAPRSSTVAEHVTNHAHLITPDTP